MYMYPFYWMDGSKTKFQWLNTTSFIAYLLLFFLEFFYLFRYKINGYFGLFLYILILKHKLRSKQATIFVFIYQYLVFGQSNKKNNSPR